MLIENGPQLFGKVFKVEGFWQQLRAEIELVLSDLAGPRCVERQSAATEIKTPHLL
ncbi:MULTISPECIES: hypothetical protein [Mesorhizobium]|jgi:hypothetical protein|uniref:hypothetical protein n=1 Tax=Mesorhizobium TaxID=68287 RepID=UPI0013DF8BB6|nr:MULTISPECIES: hypothetical protein [Mesorhizobium]